MTTRPNTNISTAHTQQEKSCQQQQFEVPENANWKLRCTSLICCSNPAPKRRYERNKTERKKSTGRATLIIHKKKNYKRGPGLWRYWALNVTRSLWSSQLPLSLISPLHETRCSRETLPATGRDISTWGCTSFNKIDKKLEKNTMYASPPLAKKKKKSYFPSVTWNSHIKSKQSDAVKFK